jgi:uncharacterized protein GlcG (DUF336 family)
MKTQTDVLPTHAQLKAALRDAQQSQNGGLGNHMWATIVDRTGTVVSVAYTGDALGDQWPGSRLISAEKANTANAFSLDVMALSTANLYSAVQPGGPLFGLASSNILNHEVAYSGEPSDYGTPDDPMVGEQIGGINTFGGGLALYADSGEIVGGLGVSGDLSCADHNIAWKVRHALELDYIPKGVDPIQQKGKPADDNIVYDIGSKTGPMTDKSASGWGHPTCTEGTTSIAASLPTDYPVRKRM